MIVSYYVSYYLIVASQFKENCRRQQSTIVGDFVGKIIGGEKRVNIILKMRFDMIFIKQ